MYTPASCRARLPEMVLLTMLTLGNVVARIGVA
jgi:hypothetical protein